MNYPLSFLLAGLCIVQLNNPLIKIEKSGITPVNLLNRENTKEPHQVGRQDKPDHGKMSAAEFKAQEYCRAEMENFDFDARFSIISATVYFSGANFKNVEKGFISSASLKPIRNQMDRCTAGTIVVFDDVKVIGPDKELRTIQGVSYMLY